MMTKRLRVLLLAGVAVLSMAAFYGCGGTRRQHDGQQYRQLQQF